MRRAIGCLLAVTLLLLCGCAGKRRNEPQVSIGQPSYTQISQEEARGIMETEDDCAIVDVRTQEEYDEGHIVGAICVPNEQIGSAPLEVLPDLNQILLIYCRSGRRSKEAAEKLSNIGYTQIYEFGGINTWTGEIER